MGGYREERESVIIFNVNGRDLKFIAIIKILSMRIFHTCSILSLEICG
jgi:hypothetical protein